MTCADRVIASGGTGLETGAMKHLGWARRCKGKVVGGGGTEVATLVYM